MVRAPHLSSPTFPLTNLPSLPENRESARHLARPDRVSRAAKRSLRPATEHRHVPKTHAFCREMTPLETPWPDPHPVNKTSPGSSPGLAKLPV